jgi:High potential iron-sulfur protein
VSQKKTFTRRSVLRRAALALPLIPLAAVSSRQALANAAAGALPLLSSDDPQAKQLKYVTDAKQASAAKPDSTCANCALYQGSYGSAQGPCQIFPGKAVKAAGWCSAWAPQM